MSTETVPTEKRPAEVPSRQSVEVNREYVAKLIRLLQHQNNGDEPVKVVHYSTKTSQFNDVVSERPMMSRCGVPIKPITSGEAESRRPCDLCCMLSGYGLVIRD